MNLAFLKADIGIKFVALGLGTFLWIYVQSLESAKSTKSFQIPLRIEQNNPDLAFVSATDGDGRSKRTISVTMKGLAEELTDLDDAKIQKSVFTWVDLAEGQAGVVSYPVKFRVAPEFSRFEWEWDRRVTIETEPVLRLERAVSVLTTGSPQEGADYNNASVTPSTVEIIGPESQVQRVHTVRILLDLKRAQSGVELDVPVEILDSSDRPIQGVAASPAKVVVKPVLSPATPWREVFVAPKFIGIPKQGFRVVSYDIRPDIVELQGDRKLLRTQGTVSTTPVELDGLSSPVQREVRLVLPIGLKLKKPTRFFVRILIEAEPPIETKPTGAP